MHIEVALLLGAGLGMIVAYLATPIAIRVADRYEFYDRPRGYKGHAAPTPYLGGSAVMLGFVVGVAVLTDDVGRTWPIVAGAVVLWALGTVDDKRTVPPLPRVLVEAGLAVGLHALGLGWDLGLGGALDLALTVVWIVGVVNAFNLFDNMDGAAGTMGCVIAAALALLGVVRGDVWLAGTGAALCGACLGFLPHNLSSPARIFLGDGGSMPVGFAVSALAMVGSSTAAAEWQALAMGVLLIGIPVLDTGLVVVSRARRGIPLLTGGRDHLTHRTRGRVRNARAVALALGGSQALLGVLAILATSGGSAALVVMVAVYLVLAATTILFLDGPPGAAERDLQHGRPAARPGFGGVIPGLPAGTGRRVSAHLRPASLAAVGLLVGLSLFRGGLYDSADWVPVGLVVLVLLVGLGLARPLRLTTPAWVVLLGLIALAGWAMLSSVWSFSVGDALADANRVVVYAGLLGLLLISVRDRRGAIMALGGFGAGILLVGLWVELRLLVGDAGDVLLGGRLDEPLGYINALGSAIAAGFFPCLALAERHARPWVRGAAATAATLLAGLVFLSQSRGVTLAAVAAVAAVVVLAPFRFRRVVVLGVIGAALLLVSGELTQLFRDGADGTVGGAASTRAGLMLALAALGAGVAWAAASAWLAGRSAPDAARVRRATLAGLAVAGVLVAGAAVVKADAIGTRVERQYDEFVRLGTVEEGTDAGTRLLSGGGYRYDYWRVAVETFGDQPVTGVGAGNYKVPYYQDRKTPEDVRQPHSMELQVLAELGLVGMALLLAILGACAYAIARRIRAARSNATEAGLLVAALGVASVWFVHASVDWVHLVPGITAGALIALVALLRPRDGEQAWAAPSLARRGRPRAGRLAVAALIISVVTMGGISLSRHLLAERFQADARAALAGGRPAEAVQAADRSLRLASDLIPTYYTKAAALARLGDAQQALAVMRDAADREPRNWLTYVLLGDLTLRAGYPRDAADWYRSAWVLNPQDRALRKQMSDTARRAGLDPDAFGGSPSS